MPDRRVKHWTELPSIELAYFFQILLPPIGSLWLRDLKTSVYIIAGFFAMSFFLSAFAMSFFPSAVEPLLCMGTLFLYIYSIYSIGPSYRKLSGASDKPKPIIIHRSDSGPKW